MKNTTLDTINNQVSVKYIYNDNLTNLGENYYGATKRIKNLDSKMSNKPEVTANMDKHIMEQVNNKN